MTPTPTEARIIEFCREVRRLVDAWEASGTLPPARMLETRVAARLIESDIRNPGAHDGE